MILFFKTLTNSILAVQTTQKLSTTDINKLIWLFDEAEFLKDSYIDIFVVGPRCEMITPWSTNAVEITQIMGIKGIVRIEEFQLLSQTFSKEELKTMYDPMLHQLYHSIGQNVFVVNKKPEDIVLVKDITIFNSIEGLALSEKEIEYLNGVSKKL